MTLAIHELDYFNFFTGLEKCLATLSPTPEISNNNFGYFIAARGHRGIITLVVVDDDNIVGTLSLFFEPKLLRGGTWVGHIEDVAVLQEYQNKGVGAMLMSHAIGLCRKRGCYKIILDCSPAVAGFYEKAGFRVSGTCMRMDLDCGI